MKIAYLLGSLNRGGTETLLLDVFKNSDKADFEFIGIHRKDGFLRNDFYATKPTFLKLSPKFPFVNYFFKLRKILKNENVQIVHAQQFLDAFFAKVATFGTKIKVVQTLHGFEKENFILNFIIKRTNKNFFVSNYQRGFYLKKYNLKPEKQVTIYNGISFEKLDNTIEFQPLEFRSKTNLLLGSVGNFNSVRDQITICRFLNLLSTKGIDFQFVFAGARVENNASLYDNCYNFCQENNLLDKVHFLGARNDVPAILKQLDAFIYSTDHDSFGIAVIEAIAAGVPVFANDWEVILEVTNNGEWATIYKTKNEEELLEKFLDFVATKDKNKENIAQIAQKIRQKFSIENHLQSLFKEYNTL